MPAARRGRGWMRAVERLLFTVAAIAFVWYAAVHIEAAREQAALSQELEQSRATLSTGTTSADGPAAAPVPREKTARSPRAAAARPTSPSTVPRSVVARIEVPRLRLSAMAREGVDLRTLRGSAGHVPGSAMPGETGNAAFAAHRDTFFRKLEGARAGDDITVTTPEGVFHYVVSATKIVDPSDVSVLGATAEPTLTLVTCYPFDYIGSAPQRFIVTGRLAQAMR